MNHSTANKSPEIEALKKTIMDLEKEKNEYLERIKNASIILFDWDGYYDPNAKKGSASDLAGLIEEAYVALQGESWRQA